MDDNRKDILNESNRLLSKLQILAVFFADDILYKVFLRSQVIHQLFQHNEELDINKLELFHLQFTASIIELLRKIKKSNEKNVMLLSEEIRLNQELIHKLEYAQPSENDYQLEMQRQALKMKNSLRALYKVLSEDSREYPFSKNIHSFSARFANAFYHPISSELLALLTQYEERDVYTNAHAIIQRKLMGLLCKYEFNVAFFCGLVAGNIVTEVYQIINTPTFFIYYPSRNLFLLCDAVEIEHIQKSAQIEKPEGIVQDLKNKNDQLQSTMAATKSYLPMEVKQLISDHYKHISDINFLQNMSDFDAQANILKTMLNTKII